MTFAIPCLIYTCQLRVLSNPKSLRKWFIGGAESFGQLLQKILWSFWVKINFTKFIDVLTFDIYIYEENLMIMSVVASRGAPDKRT